MTSFKGRHFQSEIILWAIRWYCEYGISYHELQKMLAERGVNVDHTTIYSSDYGAEKCRYPRGSYFYRYDDGATDEREGLQLLLARAEKDDVIICTKMDRLGRNTADMIRVVDDC